MQPPPFEGPALRKKSSPLPWIIGGGVLLCCVGPLLLGGGAAYFGSKAVLPIAGCAASMTGISSALQSYADANGGKLPPAATWQKDIAPYYDKIFKNEETGPFNIPKSNEAFGCGEGSSKTAFAFNTQYAGKKIADIKDRTAAILVYETDGAPAVNRSGVYKDLGKSASPRILNQPRGWFALNGDFDPVMVEDGRQKPFKGGFRTGR